MAPAIAERRRKRQARGTSRRRADIARRAERILRTEPHYVYHSSFDAPDAEQRASEPPPATEASPSRMRAAKGADFYVAFLYATELLTREEEGYLFRKMNYLKFQAYRLRQGLDPQTATLRQVEKIETLEAEATRVRNQIVEANLRLVTARAKHFARTTGLPLDELISEGNIGLVQAVEHFDFSRGTKLSTYATWAITNKLLAYFQRCRRRSSYVVSEHAVPLDGFEGDAPAVEDSLSNAEVRETLMSLLGRLKERERIAVENRFGLTAAAEPRTLKDLAGQWGVTKQRAQQVCAGAVNKLRSMLQDAGFEADVA